MPDYTLKLFDRDLIRFSARDTGDTPEVSISDKQRSCPLAEAQKDSPEQSVYSFLSGKGRLVGEQHTGDY